MSKGLGVALLALGAFVGWVFAKAHTAWYNWRGAQAGLKGAESWLWKRFWEAVVTGVLVLIGLYAWGAGLMGKGHHR